MRTIKIVTVTILYILLITHSWKILSADNNYMEGQKELKKDNSEKALLYANKSIKKNPEEPRYRYGKAKILLSQTVKNTNKEKLKEEALNNLLVAEEKNNKNLVSLRNMVPIYYFLGIEDLTQQESANNLDHKYIPEITKFLERLKKEYPNDVGVLMLTRKYEKRLGLLEEEQTSLRQIEHLRPDLLEW